MNGKWILSKPIYIKLSRDIDNSQLITSNSPTPSIPSTNATYPAILPIPYLNIPPMFYLPTYMVPPTPNNFPLPIAPPNSRMSSIREYPSPPPGIIIPSTTTTTPYIKQQTYPYSPMKTDQQ
jgi:hypothetical protein